MNTNTITKRDLKRITDTIFEQLGGQRFAYMTGARNLIAGEDRAGAFLRMDLPRNAGKVNRLKITYKAGADIYEMYFYKMTFNRREAGFKLTNEVKVEVYAHELETVFTDKTGLYTRL